MARATNADRGELEGAAKHFAVVSAAEPELARRLGIAARAFGEQDGWPPAAVLPISGPAFHELLVWGADEADVIDSETRRAAVLFGRAAYDENGTRMAPGAVLRRVAESGRESLAGIAAPQSTLLAFGEPAQIIAATDRIGLSAVYYVSDSHVAAVASSSRLLAAILGWRLDEDALSAFALLGTYAAADTPFCGVRRLGARECARIVGHELIVEEYCGRAEAQPGDRDIAVAVRQGVAAVRASVEACVDAYPDASIELSGGLDSRLILAALLSAGHRPVEALTLGDPTSPDVVVAAALASTAGIAHRQVDLSAIAQLTAEDALRIVDNAGRRRDYSDNCVAVGVLDWVQAFAGGRVRFSGQNGEFARGFYYPFQPPWPTASSVLARALVRWRLIANERASSDLLAPDARAAGERHATATTQAFLERAGGDWLTATDFLYLYWRMQRWVGSDWSASAQDRVILAPFFHSAFITWALGSRPSHKRGSRLLARVLEAIDPDLARLPTADGKTPVSIFDPTIKDRVGHATGTGRKVAVKLRQRVKDATKPPAGADAMSRLALQAMRDERVRLERVAALPFISGEYVERLAEGREASPATVGLLAALSGLVATGPPEHRIASERLRQDLAAAEP
jgi:asparagine synthase (glutamine-hydrolysing)